MFLLDQFFQTRLQSVPNGIALDTSSLVFFLSMTFFLSLIGPAMNSKQIARHRLPPAGYWFLIALDAHGPSKVSDLVALDVFSLHAIHEGARAALELGLCAKDGTTWVIPSENQQSTTNYTPENQQNDEKRHSENQQNDENSESSSRDLSSSVVKPLKDKDLRKTQVVVIPELNDIKGKNNQESQPENEEKDEDDKKGENYRVSLFYEYGQSVLELDADTCRRLWVLGQGNRARFWQVIDCYRWNHTEGGGDPVKNVLAWANRTLQNGVNKQTPGPFTFAYWAEDRAWQVRARENRARLDAEKARDDALRAAQRNENALPPTVDQHARIKAREAWQAESATHPAPKVFAPLVERQAHAIRLADWIRREPK